MAQQDTLRKHVVSELRACVISVKNGIPLSRINEEYAFLMGVPIPLSQLGYCSVEAFFNSAAEFQLEPCRNQPGEFRVLATQNNCSSHIQALVSKQKLAKQKTAYRKPMARGYSSDGRGSIGYMPKGNLPQLKNERKPVPNLPHRSARHSLNNRYTSDGEQRNHVVSRPLTQIQQNNRNGLDATFKKGHYQSIEHCPETRLRPQKKFPTKANNVSWGAVHERDNPRLQVEDVSEEGWVSGKDWDIQPEPCYQANNGSWGAVRERDNRRLQVGDIREEEWVSGKDWDMQQEPFYQIDDDDDDENWKRNVRHSNVFGLQIRVLNLNVIRGNYRDSTSHPQRKNHQYPPYHMWR